MPDTRRALLLAACAWPLASHAQAFDLKALMQRLRQRTSGEARFTEERIVSGFDSPLRSSGTLSFAAPDRFARHTLQPVQESAELQGRTLLLRRSGRTRQMDLDAVPEVASLLDAMRATLTGDLAQLQLHFRVELSGNDAKWVLLLTPVEARLQRQLRQIEVVGQAADVRSIAMSLPNGDRSLMLLEPVTPGR